MVQIVPSAPLTKHNLTSYNPFTFLNPYNDSNQTKLSTLQNLRYRPFYVASRRIGIARRHDKLARLQIYSIYPLSSLQIPTYATIYIMLALQCIETSRKTSRNGNTKP